MGTFDFLKAVSLNAVLYYADYLSLYYTSIPVTDTCKYFIIYGTPVNAAYMDGHSPIYDENNQYTIWATTRRRRRIVHRRMYKIYKT